MLPGMVQGREMGEADDFGRITKVIDMGVNITATGDIGRFWFGGASGSATCPGGAREYLHPGHLPPRRFSEANRRERLALRRPM